MKIAQAQQLKPGDTINCPADRGDAGYTARVKHVGREINKNVHGVEYLWVGTTNENGRGGALWPSNRIR